MPQIIFTKFYACIFFNYRADRGRQMTELLTGAMPKLHFTTMTQYDKALKAPFVLSKELPSHILANVMADMGWESSFTKLDALLAG